MRGTWEIMVKLAKSALKTVTNDKPLYKEVLTTCLVEVESMFDSRPLTLVSDDYNDLQVLTPNHFLTGKATKHFSINKFPQSDINSQKSWKSVQTLANMFLTTFIKVYLRTLQDSKKWSRITGNLVVNDTVLVQNENVPRSFWSLARIIDVHVGNDRIVKWCKTKLG